MNNNTLHKIEINVDHVEDRNLYSLQSITKQKEELLYDPISISIEDSFV